MLSVQQLQLSDTFSALENDMPSPVSLCISLSYTYIYMYTLIYQLSCAKWFLNSCLSRSWLVSRIPVWCVPTAPSGFFVQDLLQLQKNQGASLFPEAFLASDCTRARPTLAAQLCGLRTAGPWGQHNLGWWDKLCNGNNCAFVSGKSESVILWNTRVYFGRSISSRDGLELSRAPWRRPVA